MLHRDHRTFGKHRSCKHPIHLPLVEWHCGKRSCHVNLVICVEGYSSLAVLGFLSSRSHIFHHLIPIARVVPAYMYGFVPFSFPFRCILVSLMYFPIFGICM
ncbi:hypothetical protein L210DRAFT_2011610 [Boletus edulis BED1]|uniref:Uncharacterized protein n=1 Tax=Boletus edulis BED1 TaxID=1328754 RepID=A0AAD4C821_BOLED|nr:hypothetical protein L210DRAFT_2011610 [Boletus edulis BED1]